MTKAQIRKEYKKLTPKQGAAEYARLEALEDQFDDIIDRSETPDYNEIETRLIVLEELELDG